MPQVAPAIVLSLLKAIRRRNHGCRPIYPLSRRGYSQPCFFSVAHHVILSHALVVKLYRDEFKSTQGGVIGITLNGDMAIPYDESPESRRHLLRPIIKKFSAIKQTLMLLSTHSILLSVRVISLRIRHTHLAHPFYLIPMVRLVRGKLTSKLCFPGRGGQVIYTYLLQDPVYLGYYPEYMKQVLGDRLPEFSSEEWAIVKGSSDFYGMNTYTTNLCSTSLDPCAFRREAERV